MEQDRLGQLVRQHAETARLLGVDFVPAYRSGGGEDPEGVEPSVFPTEPEAEPGPVIVETRPVVVAPTVVVEAKPSGAVGAGRGEKQAALDALRARYEKDCPHKDFVTQYTNL